VYADDDVGIAGNDVIATVHRAGQLDRRAVAWRAIGNTPASIVPIDTRCASRDLRVKPTVAMTLLQVRGWHFGGIAEQTGGGAPNRGRPRREDEDRRERGVGFGPIRRTSGGDDAGGLEGADERRGLIERHPPPRRTCRSVAGGMFGSTPVAEAEASHRAVSMRTDRRWATVLERD
jgi:hypothetical protein